MEQRSAEWHSLRKTKIGASEAAIILGVSPWRTPFELWQEKTGNSVKVPFTNPYMQRGIDLEPEALQAFELATGYLMKPEVIVSQKNEFMMASLDGLDLDGKIAVEIKVPGVKDHETAISGKIPEKYIPQLQHQIEVTGLDMIYYMSYSPDHEVPISIWKVKRDDAYIANLIEKERHFYEHHMLNGIPPEKDIQEIHTDQWILLSDEYKKLDYQYKDIEKRRDEIKDMLIQISNNKDAQGNGIILQRIERKGIIPYSSIPEIKKMDLEKHRKPSTSSWRIS